MNPPPPLYIAWRSGDPAKARWGPVGRLEFDSGVYRFVYTRGARTMPGFAPFPGLPRLDDVYESDDLFPIFQNRLLSKSRPEYRAFLAWSGFNPDHPPEPLVLLGVTEGIRQTDSLELFPCPTPDSEGRYLTRFFLHGVRWMPEPSIQRIARLQPDETLRLMLDISNPYDRLAVAVRTEDRFMIGYVPRYLAREVQMLCVTCHPDFIQLNVERANPGAPMQMRVLCRMNACWPPDFHPCAGEEFRPIVDEAVIARGSTGARA